MMRVLIVLVLVAVGIWACEDSGGGGGGPVATVPTLGPLGGEIDPLTPVRPTEGPIMPGGSQYANKAVMVRAEVTRYGFAIDAAGLSAIGWTVDMGKGRAWWTGVHGTESIVWGVPSRTITADLGEELWISGEVTSRSGSNLNLQIGIGGIGWRDGSYLETAAMSNDAVPTSVPQVRTSCRIPERAIPGEAARVEVNLGWQSDGVKPVYHYVYQADADTLRRPEEPVDE